MIKAIRIDTVNRDHLSFVLDIITGSKLFFKGSQTPKRTPVFHTLILTQFNNDPAGHCSYSYWLIDWLRCISPRDIKRIAMKRSKDIQSFFFKKRSQSQPQLLPAAVKKPSQVSSLGTAVVMKSSRPPLHGMVGHVQIVPCDVRPGWTHLNLPCTFTFKLFITSVKQVQWSEISLQKNSS